MAITFADWTQELIDLNLNKEQRDHILHIMLKGLEFNIEAGEFKLQSPNVNIKAMIENPIHSGHYDIDIEGVDNRQVLGLEFAMDYSNVDPINFKLTYSPVALPNINIFQGKK